MFFQPPLPRQTQTSDAPPAEIREVATRNLKTATPPTRRWHLPGGQGPLLLTYSEAEVQCAMRGRLPGMADLDDIRAELWEDQISGDFWTAEIRDGKHLVFSVSPGRAATAWRKPGAADERLQVLCI